MCEGNDPGVHLDAILTSPLELRGAVGRRMPFDPKTGDCILAGYREKNGEIVQEWWNAEKQRWVENS